MNTCDAHITVLKGPVYKSVTKAGCKIFVVLCLLLPVSRAGRAQTIVAPSALLQQIANLQQQKTDFFYKGSFPSYRLYGRGTKLKPDNNIFFTGLIAFTLKQLRPFLNEDRQALCDTIIQRAKAAYPHFENREGYPTYNFWQTSPPVVFPNSWFLTRFNQSQALPDDLDDTSILWLSQDPSDSILAMVKKMMAAHANGQFNRVNNTYSEYRQLPAYSTWFGVKMAVDFDFCVLCNVLYFVYYYDLPLNEHDSATISLLEEMITDGYYKTAPAYISPHYGRTPLLLYHISRLLNRFSIPKLDRLKPELLTTAYYEYHAADNWLDSVLLSTAIIRLDGKRLPVSPPDTSDLYAAEKTFFVASFAGMLANFWKKLLLPSEWIKYYFVCPAYRQTLYLENIILKQKNPTVGEHPKLDSLFVLYLNIFCTI